MKALGAVLLGLLVWLGWELAGAVVAELLAAVLRPFKVLVRPPLGAWTLVLIWGLVIYFFLMGVREPTTSLGVVGFVVAIFGLLLSFVVRDQYREAMGLPQVKTKLPGQLSVIQRFGFGLLAMVAAGTAMVMLVVIGPEEPETWVTAAGCVLFMVIFGGAALRGRFSESAASLLGGEVDGADAKRSSGG